MTRKDHFHASDSESGSPDERMKQVKDQGALLIRSFLEFLLESIQNQDGQTLTSNHAMADTPYDPATVVKDFEIFMDNRPSKLYFEALNISVPDQQPEIKIKPKQKTSDRHTFRPKINKSKIERDPTHIGNRLMNKGEEYRQKKQVRKRIKEDEEN